MPKNAQVVSYSDGDRPDEYALVIGGSGDTLHLLVKSSVDGSWEIHNNVKQGEGADHWHERD